MLVGVRGVATLDPVSAKLRQLTGQRQTNLYFACSLLKGVFSKPSGNPIVALNLCFLELETLNFGYLLIFCFPLTVQKFQQDWTTVILDSL